MPEAPPRRKPASTASRSAPKPRSSPSKTGGARSSSPKAGGAPKKPRQKILLVICAVLGLFLIGTSVLVGMLDGYGWVDRTRHADAIVILGAQVRPDGKPGQGLMLRISHALKLYKKGMAQKIICTGGRGTYPPAEADAAAKVLRDHGVPQGDIFIENQSTSTWENACYAAEICHKQGWKTVVIASDPFHLWRAERNFAKCGIKGYGSPVARDMWKAQPLRKYFWTTREAILVMRDWCLRRV